MLRMFRFTQEAKPKQADLREHTRLVTPPKLKTPSTPSKGHVRPVKMLRKTCELQAGLQYV